MTITREQAIAIAQKHLDAVTGRAWLGLSDWVIDAIIEASQPIADVQAEGSERVAFEAWLKTKPETIYWNTGDAMFAAWQAATVAHRQQQAAAKGGE